MKKTGAPLGATRVQAFLGHGLAAAGTSNMQSATAPPLTGEDSMYVEI